MSNAKDSKRVRKLRDALTAKGIDATNVDIHWEPVGPDFEMMGCSGGWFVGGESIGLNLHEALDFIVRFSEPRHFNQ